MKNPLITMLQRRDSLTDEERTALEAAVSKIKEFGPDEDLVRDGDRATQSNLILEGFAYRYKVLGDGRRQITAFHTAGDFVDLHSFLLKKMDHSVGTLTRCRVAFFPHDKLRELTDRYPHLMRLMWLLTLIDASMHREWITGMGRRSAEGRLAHLFCEMFLRLDIIGQTDGLTFPFPVTQQELGDALGMSIVHTNRLLGRLRKLRLVTFINSRASIENWDGLKELAEFDPTYLHLESEPR